MIYLETKHGVNLNDLKMLQPAMWIILTRVVLYTTEHDLPLKVTSIIRDRKNVKSVSNSHKEGRAIDISIKGWSEMHQHRLVYLINSNYADIGAISYSDNKARAAVLHDSGYGKHIHLQVRPKANINKFIEE